MVTQLAQSVVSSADKAYRYDLTDLPFILLEVSWVATDLIAPCRQIRKSRFIALSYLSVVLPFNSST